MVCCKNKPIKMEKNVMWLLLSVIVVIINKKYKNVQISELMAIFVTFFQDGSFQVHYKSKFYNNGS